MQPKFHAFMQAVIVLRTCSNLKSKCIFSDTQTIHTTNTMKSIMLPSQMNSAQCYCSIKVPGPFILSRLPFHCIIP